jgi:hypothetical protein
LLTWGTLSDERKVWRLQQLLVFASAVILKSESCGTHIIPSQIRDSPNLKSHVAVYPPGTGWPNCTPRHGFPFRGLLRLTGLRRRYLNAGMATISQVVLVL